MKCMCFVYKNNDFAFTILALQENFYKKYKNILKMKNKKDILYDNVIVFK